ncbi:hypothetical protein CASFOL_033698 [Castilleja foliolosa]|uniref:Uncharacterized protein n=1 Tax=Castilleja foliolosa TaxID=1961234 RepID=A0ABD3BYA3_9LAMI
MGRSITKLMEYQCRSRMVKEQEILNSLLDYKFNETKTLLYEFRTNFFLRTKPPVQPGVSAPDVFIDSDRFRGVTYDRMDIRNDVAMLFKTTSPRLGEYGMTRDQIAKFTVSVVGFARMMAARPENVNLDLIPIVVDFEVFTVQQEEETFEQAMDRAISADKLASQKQANSSSSSALFA